MAGVKVDTFLGFDIEFDAKTGKFSTRFGGEYHYGKTIAEVQNQITTHFTRKAERTGSVPVVQFNKPARIGENPGRYNTLHRGPDYFGDISDVVIRGVDVDRGRGRGARTEVLFKTDRGNRSATTTFHHPNPEVKEEFEAVMKEWKESNLAFYNKALDVLDKFQEFPGTEIFDALLNGNDKPKLKVVS